jgi:hypothetical protein
VLAPRSAAALVPHPVICFALLAGVAAAVIIGKAFIIPLLALMMVPLLVGADIPRVKRSLEGRAQRRALRARRELRETRLENAQFRRDGLFELTTLVDSIVSNGASHGEQMDLEELLDHYVDVACARAQCQIAVVATDRTSLVHALESVSPRSPQAELRRTLIERRIACWTEARDRAAVLDEELAVTTELVRLLAQRSALAGIEVIDFDKLSDAVLAQLEEVSVEVDE